MYVAVIIGVDDVVYAVCKYERRFNPSPIHIEGVDFAKFLRVSMKLISVECRLISPKFRRFYVKATKA